ncbi:hypothetical protein OCU04_003820 [Sclerotinia nivalis]|uniref:Uncharacterized protein n=1 Tax=Sclerotinia nivalis TaxID=352851 RepID=A0A9X0DPP2_9HELO|nr:hypothetical protein OCU04_003820 [Sclerotinia nivalis]
MLPTDDLIAICFGLSSIFLAILSIFIMCKQQIAPEPDLEQGRQLTNLPPNRSSSLIASRNTPSRTSILSQNGTEIDDDSASLRATPQRSAKRYQVFAMLVPAMIFGALSSSDVPILV